MKRFSFFIFIALIFTGCHENIEERAAREAKEYTERFCPTPVINNTRTDSVGFNKDKREYIYYCSFLNAYDNEMVIKKASQDLHEGMKETLANNPAMKLYIDEGFSFTYIVRSGSNPEKVLYHDTINFSKK